MSDVMQTGMEERYRSLAVATYRVDGGLTILTSLSPSDIFVVDTTAAAVLGHCLAERSLDGHVSHAARALRQDADSVRGHVIALVSRGLLRPLGTWPAVADETSTDASSSQARVSRVTVVTADRPAHLARCLTSYIRHFETHGRTLPIVVVDGSRDEGNAKAVERLVADVNRGATHDVRYLGVASRRAIRERACAHGVEPAVLDWLLPDLPHPGFPGVVRNHVLLSTIGHALLSVDDDTVGEVWEPEHREAGLDLVGHLDPRETQCFSTRAEAFAAASSRESSVDLIERHEALLGHRLQDLAEIWRGRRTLEDVCPHLLPAVEGTRPTWKVRATWAGIAGDAATYCAHPILFVANATRDRLAASDEALRVALSSREVVRAVRRFTVTDEPWFMSYCAGIDNRRLVPPFNPVCWNEDGLFGAMLRLCDPGAFFGQLPCGVLHDSSRPSQRDPNVIPSASFTRIADVLQWLAAPWAVAETNSDPAERMRGLGRFFADFRRLDRGAWKALLTNAAVGAKRRALVAVELVLERDFAYPTHMRQAIRRYQQAVLDSVSSPALVVPAEYHDRPSPERAMADLQEHVATLGDALIAWPAIWESQRGHLD